MKISQSFGVHFTTRADKEKEGSAPVYACITVNKKRCYIAIKQLVDIDYRDNKKCALKGTREEFKWINKYLQDVLLTLQINSLLPFSNLLSLSSDPPVHGNTSDSIFQEYSDLG